MTGYRKGVNCIGRSLLPTLPPKLYLEDGQGQDLMPNHGWGKGIRVAAEFVGCAGSSVRKEEERGGSDGGWLKAISGSINGLFDSCINIFTFCLHLSYTSPSSNCHEKCIAPPPPPHPPISLVIEYWVDVFPPSVPVYLSHLLPLSSFALITQHSYIERAEALGAFCGTALERGRKKWGVFSPRRAGKLPRSCRGGAGTIAGICSLVFALGLWQSMCVCMW